MTVKNHLSVDEKFQTNLKIRKNNYIANLMGFRSFMRKHDYLNFTNLALIAYS